MERLMIECAIRAALIGTATALALGLLRVKNAAARHAAWTGVLLAMLLLPAWTAWGPRAPVRVLPAPAVVEPIATVTTMDHPQPAGVEPSRPAPHHRAIPWREMLLGVYLLGVLWPLLRLIIGTIRANRLTSADCVAPITVGLFRPRVILPVGWQEWPAEKIGPILAHERAHVCRRDPLVQWLALLNRALFWFHPLAWWIERRLAALAEEACDAAVLAQGHDARDYAQCLIEAERFVMLAGSRFALGMTSVGMTMPGSALPHRVKLLFDGAAPARLSRPRAILAAAACLTGGIVFGAGSLERAPQVLKLERWPELMLPKPPEITFLQLLAQVQTRTPEAQQPAPAKPDPTFEVVSVRPADIPALLKGTPMIVRRDDAAFVNSNITMMDLLSIAYETAWEYISGPSWLTTTTFEINAKLPAGAKSEQVPGMLRSMLADRFKLQLHHVPKTEDVYRLKIGKNGIKFKEASPDTPAALKGRCPQRPGHTQCRSISLGSWVASQNRFIRTMVQMGQPMNSDGMIDLPVIDETGLTGLYDFDLEWIPADGTGIGQADQRLPPDSPALGLDPPRPSTKARTISEAFDAIGLHLERSKHDANAIVIDHLEKTPTEN
jgi:uncharacterized protein (TIGR03435 family)